MSKYYLCHMLGNNLCQSHANKKTLRHQENQAI